MNSSGHYAFPYDKNTELNVSPRNHVSEHDDGYVCISRCRFCNGPLRDNCNIYMFQDNKFCSELCRDNAIAMCEQRRF